MGYRARASETGDLGSETGPVVVEIGGLGAGLGRGGDGRRVTVEL